MTFMLRLRVGELTHLPLFPDMLRVSGTDIFQKNIRYLLRHSLRQFHTHTTPRDALCSMYFVCEFENCFGVLTANLCLPLNFNRETTRAPWLHVQGTHTHTSEPNTNEQDGTATSRISH